VFDTLLMAAGIPAVYTDQSPADGYCIVYGAVRPAMLAAPTGLTVAHDPAAWAFFDGEAAFPVSAQTVSGLRLAFPARTQAVDGLIDIDVDLIANAFYFLSSWWERRDQDGGQLRQLYANSAFVRLSMPSDIVDLYLARLSRAIEAMCRRSGAEPWHPARWPDDRRYALVLSHDVDFVPHGLADNLKQGAKTVLRHLIRQRDPADAARAAGALVRTLARGADPYGCVPGLIAREQAEGVRSSFQVAVGRRHPNDVNYRIGDDAIRDYLRAIVDAGFDLCLHGSYLSTRNTAWYVEEVALLAERLVRPLGSRQHFLSFNYDSLFGVQQSCGIEYDMSMGYPDQVGPRCGFSHPYFPYDLAADRPYDVLQISLVLMDVTLRSYLDLRPDRAWPVIERQLADLRFKGGCASVVWHPIVFAGARDPGYDTVYWRMIEEAKRTDGLATDGRTVNAHWRQRASAYASFQRAQ